MTSPYESGVIGTFNLGNDPFGNHPFIDSLAWRGFMWGNAQAGGTGTGTVITYSFPTADATWATDYANGEPSTGFVPFTEAQQDAARQALALWAEVANITFVEVTESENEVGDIRFASSAAVTGAAQAYMPYVDGISEHPESGDIWLNSGYEPNLQLQPGQEGFATLLQAIGRALGLDDPALDHPGDPNEVALVGPDAEFDTGQYSIMSSISDPSTLAYVSSPQLVDILALQYIYGRNMTTRTGDDVYQFSATEQVNKTIWDAGGIDTLDLSNQTSDARIELWQGAYSRFNEQDGTTSLVGIAYEAQIENAIGGSGNDTVYGNELANHLQGGDGNDQLGGFEGDDILEGGNGDDELLGSTGNDTLDGGAGADVMIGDSGDDLYLVDDSADQVVEYLDEGYDTILSTTSYDMADGLYVEVLKLVGAGDLSASGNYSDNTLIGNAGKNILVGNAGADILEGGAGADTLDGGADADTLDGGTGADTLIGGRGDDTYVIDSARDVIDEGLNTDSGDTVRSTISVNLMTLANGAIENAVLLGTAVRATGNDADNELVGNDGANILDGGAGADTLTGGQGNDIYVVNDVNDLTIEDLDQGIDTVRSSVDWTLGANLENLVLLDGAISGIGNELDNRIVGNDSNNDLYGGDGNDTLNGGAGADTLYGGEGDDVFVVDNKDDVIVMDFDQGHDTVRSSVDFWFAANEHLEDLVLLGDANLSGSGNELANKIIGNNGDNSLTGFGGDDLLSGGDGNDYLDGGTGNDRMRGGAGDDFYVVDSAGDKVIEAADGGSDHVQTSVDFTLSANLENMTISGGTHFVGNEFDNRIINQSGHAVTIDGGAGNDVLWSVGAVDTLIGGAGDDYYIFSFRNAIVVEAVGGGEDTIEAWQDIDLGSYANVENVWLNVGVTTAAGNGLSNKISGDSTANVLYGLDGNDTLVGDRDDGAGAVGSDKLYGGNGGDWLKGSRGSDVLDGGDGEDTLVAGWGADELTGGAGRDTFKIDAIGGLDTVTDFQSGANGDTVDLRDVLSGYDGVTSDLNDLVRFTNALGGTLVQVDADGAGGEATFVDTVLLQGVTLSNVGEAIASGNLVVHDPIT